MGRRRRAGLIGAAAPIALAALLLAGCAQGDHAEPAGYAARAERACPGASAGAQALDGGHRDGDGVIARVRAAERTATRAGTLLDHVTPPPDRVERHEEAVRALLRQATRLRLVRDQIRRGSPPATVLRAARRGLDDGDRQTTARLAAIGVRDC